MDGRKTYIITKIPLTISRVSMISQKRKFFVCVFFHFQYKSSFSFNYPDESTTHSPKNVSNFRLFFAQNDSTLESVWWRNQETMSWERTNCRQNEKFSVRFLPILIPYFRQNTQELKFQLRFVVLENASKRKLWLSEKVQNAIFKKQDETNRWLSQ